MNGRIARLLKNNQIDIRRRDDFLNYVAINYKAEYKNKGLLKIGEKPPFQKAISELLMDNIKRWWVQLSEPIKSKIIVELRCAKEIK